MDDPAPSPWHEKSISEFIAEGSSFRDLLIPFVTIVSIRGSEHDTIVSARLTYASPTASLEERSFESNTIRAVAKPLDSIATADQFIRSVATGWVTLGGRRYAFPAPEGGVVSIGVQPFQKGAVPQTRFCVLTMLGHILSQTLNIERVDWELKAARPPYINLQELILEYQCPVPTDHAVFDSLYATPLIIDNERSGLAGEIATIAIKAERSINKADIDIGVIAIKAGERADRKTYNGGELNWDDDGKFAIGSLMCEVPPGRAVQAVVSLKGVSFHYWWIIDPLNIMNPRKAVYEVVDPGLGVLRDIFTNVSKGASRDFESAVSWLLWMLGFAVTYLGSNRQTQDAFDILASTPAGHFALVECTTGVISTDRKIPNLLRRRVLVIEKLRQSSHNAAHVIPVLVTSCGREEVEHEIMPAEQRGVFVVTRDDLLEMLNQTQFVGNADTLYSEVEERLAAVARANQPGIPGI